METTASINGSKFRIKRVVFASILSISIVLSGLGPVLFSSSASALVGDYEWTEAVGKYTGFEGDQFNWAAISSSADGTKLAAVVDAGYIYTSQDSGATWTERTSAGFRVWSAIASSADGTVLAATVRGGYIYTSQDSGATWTERTSAGSSDWRSIVSSDDGIKLVAGRSFSSGAGYIYTSQDSGATWTERTSAGANTWGSIAGSNDSTKLVAYGGSRIYTSTNSGATWTQRNSAGSRTWRSVTSSTDGTKLAAVVEGGYIYTSQDSGATWTERTSAGSRSWREVTSSADGVKLATYAYNNYIYTSQDSGATWTERTSAGSRSWSAIASSTDGTKLVVAEANGSIYTSIDSGATWTERTVMGSRKWGEVTSSADGVKLATYAYNNYIYTSQDSGATWTERTSAGSRSWSAIASSTDGTKLAAVADYIYTSIDSGATWTQQALAGARVWSAITSSANGDKLAAVVSGGYVYTSRDFGVTWTEHTSLGSLALQSITSNADGTKIFVGTEGEGIWRSTNGGMSWTQINNIAFPGSSWYSIAMTSDANTVVALDTYGSDWLGGFAYISHDAGESWTQATALGARYWQDWAGSAIAVSGDGSKIALLDMYGSTTNNSKGGYIYTSLDGGMNWVENTANGAGSWLGVAISADGTKIVASSDFYNPGIYIATLTQPTLLFTPSENPTDDPVIPSSTNPASPQLITQTQPTFTGVTYPNSPVTVTVYSDPITCSTVSDNQGNWSCTLPSTIPPGNHTVIIELTNSANGQTENLGPYYVQVLGDGTTITSVTPRAPNTGIRPVEGVVNLPAILLVVFSVLFVTSLLALGVIRTISKR